MDFIREFIKYFSGREDGLGLSIPLSLSPTPQDIAKAIELLGDPKSDWGISQWLDEHLDEARPILEMMYRSGQLESIDPSKIKIKEKVIGYLARAGSPVVDRVINMRWSENDQKDRDVAYLACLSCTPGVMNVVLSSLDFSSEFYQGTHLRMLANNRRYSTWPESDRQVLFEKIYKLLFDANDSAVAPAVKILFDLNASNARKLLNDSKLIHLKTRIIEPLQDQGVEIDSQFLAELYQSTPQTAENGKKLCHVLNALAREKYPGTLEWIEQCKKTIPKQMHGLRDAIMSWHDLDPSAVIRAVDPKVEYAPLNKNQMIYVTILALYNQVGNGGIVQYYTNSYGNWVREAVEGLEVLGLKSIADAVRATFEPFGINGPNRDRQIRNQQLDSLFPEDSTQNDIPSFEQVDKLLMDETEAIFDRLLEFTIENKHDFSLKLAT